MVSLRIPPPILMIIIASAMFFLTKYVGIASFDFPGRRALAISFAVTGFTVDLISIVAFFRAKTTVNPLAPARAQKLVISGIYRYSRNPMYLGLALTLTGWFFWLGALPSLALVVLFIWLITEFQIKPEERALLEKFGDEYTVYCKKVRRWI